jgi:hypothetical protein
MLSSNYRQQLEQIHTDDRWGVVGWTQGGYINQLRQQHHCASVLDYGSGHGSLARWFYKNSVELDLREYEPGIAAKSSLPTPADLVVCVDVMEHVEPEYVGDVLDHIQSLAHKCVYFSIDTAPAERLLPDGRNAHLVQKPSKWWRKQLNTRWHPIKSWQDHTKFRYVALV